MKYFCLLLLLSGCAGLEGQQLGSCTLHQANSFTAGIVFAECPANGKIYVPGSAEGYI